MRLFAFIMSIIVLTLTIEPGINSLLSRTSVETACCDNCSKPDNKKDNKKQPTDHNKTSDNSCNPFQSCSTCIGFTIESPIVNFTIQTQSNIELSLLTHQISSQFYPDFWQPPKIS